MPQNNISAITPEVYAQAADRIERLIARAHIVHPAAAGQEPTVINVPTINDINDLRKPDDRVAYIISQNLDYAMAPEYRNANQNPHQRLAWLRAAADLCRAKNITARLVSPTDEHAQEGRNAASIIIRTLDAGGSVETVSHDNGYYEFTILPAGE